MSPQVAFPILFSPNSHPFMEVFILQIFAWLLLCILGGTALYVLITKVFFTLYQIMRDARQMP